MEARHRKETDWLCQSTSQVVTAYLISHLQFPSLVGSMTFYHQPKLSGCGQTVYGLVCWDQCWCPVQISGLVQNYIQQSLSDLSIDV